MPCQVSRPTHKKSLPRKGTVIMMGLLPSKQTKPECLPKDRILGVD